MNEEASTGRVIDEVRKALGPRLVEVLGMHRMWNRILTDAAAIVVRPGLRATQSRVASFRPSLRPRLYRGLHAVAPPEASNTGWSDNDLRQVQMPSDHRVYVGDRRVRST